MYSPVAESKETWVRWTKSEGVLIFGLLEELEKKPNLRLLDFLAGLLAGKRAIWVARMLMTSVRHKAHWSDSRSHESMQDL